MNHIRSFRDCLARLSCCFNCEEDSTNQGNEPNMRTHLLVDPVSNSPAVRRTNSDDFINEYPNSLPKKDEQNALSRIVQETAINIIDVASMDAHNLEPQEYSDRIKLYSHRLAQQWNIYHANNEFTGLLQDIPNPEVQLASNPISAADLNMMKSVVHKAAIALNGIKVEHKEDLVVPFRIP